MDKLLESVVRGFANDTKKLNDSELADYFHNEDYLKIEGFDIDKHLSIVLEFIEEDRGLDLIYDQEETKQDTLQKENTPLNIDHKIALSFTNYEKNLFHEDLVFISFEFGKSKNQMVEDFLSNSELNINDYLFQEGEIIESINSNGHSIIHLYSVSTDLPNLKSISEIDNFNVDNSLIWISIISKYILFNNTGKNETDILKQKIKNIERGFK